MVQLILKECFIFAFFSIDTFTKQFNISYRDFHVLVELQVHKNIHKDANMYILNMGKPSKCRIGRMTKRSEQSFCILFYLK